VGRQRADLKALAKSKRMSAEDAKRNAAFHKVAGYPAGHPMADKGSVRWLRAANG
jgi:hypothetical protein